jgi:hypothetical protein
VFSDTGAFFLSLRVIFPTEGSFFPNLLSALTAGEGHGWDAEKLRDIQLGNMSRLMRLLCILPI